MVRCPQAVISQVGRSAGSALSPRQATLFPRQAAPQTGTSVGSTGTLPQANSASPQPGRSKGSIGTQSQAGGALSQATSARSSQAGSIPPQAVRVSSCQLGRQYRHSSRCKQHWYPARKECRQCRCSIPDR